MIAAPAKPVIDFSDSATAFASKSDGELKLAYWLFRMVSHPTLVKIGGKLAMAGVQLGLPINGLIKKTLYRHFCGGENLLQAEKVIHQLAGQNVDTVLDYAAEAQDNETGYDNVMGEILRNIQRAKNNPDISCISLKMTGLGPTPAYEKLQAGQELSIEESVAYDRARARLNRICQLAETNNVRVYIDAEESWLQDPIDQLAEEMMQRYNRNSAIVFNTLQMYRVDRVSYLENLLQKHENSGFVLGIKLVRGAYLEKEQKRAEGMGYSCPVFRTKSDTDLSFDTAAQLTLQHLHHAELCAATHNENSSRLILEQIEKDHFTSANRAKIAFSQLFGMSDNLTFNLARAGYRTSKYLPYGTLQTALPYLIRRAEENTSISGQMGRELSLIKQEMKRRKLA